jgi:uncharacterized protein (TIGR02147 family)
MRRPPYPPPMIQSVPYRQQLQQKLAERCQRKPGYSLRAFARDLGYGAPQLSRVLNGKQHLSLPNAELLANRLFESETERAGFIAQVAYESTSKPTLKAAALEKLNRALTDGETHLVQQDAFTIISEWYHFPLLDLMTLHLAPQTPAAIGRYLGISAIEAKLAIERLIRVGLLKQEGKRLLKTHGKLTVPSGGPRAGIRRFHRSMIEKARDAIESQTVEERYLSARTIGLAPKDLPKLRAAVDDFMEKVAAISAASKPKSRIYQVNTQLFDLASDVVRQGKKSL